jgi:hypothetical protein
VRRYDARRSREYRGDIHRTTARGGKMIIPGSHIPNRFTTRKEEQQFEEIKKWKEGIDNTVEVYEKAIGKSDITAVKGDQAAVGDLDSYELHNTGPDNHNRVLGSGSINTGGGGYYQTEGELDIDPKDPKHVTFKDKESSYEAYPFPIHPHYSFEQTNGEKIYTSTTLGEKKTLTIDESTNDWNISHSLSL